MAESRNISALRARDRIRGVLIGLAVGDAVGGAVEFNSPGTFTPITDMIGGGPWDLKPGEFTDDTSMALCLAESLSEKREFDPKDQIDRYVRWWRDGHLSAKGHCFDIGPTTRAALQRYIQNGDPFAGSTDPMTSGTGLQEVRKREVGSRPPSSGIRVKVSDRDLDFTPVRARR